MNISCLNDGHSPSETRFWNGGICFSACAHCGAGLSRGAGEPWKEVPRRLKAAWKEALCGTSSGTAPRPAARYAPTPAEPVVLFRPSRDGVPASLHWEHEEEAHEPRRIDMLAMLFAGLNLLMFAGPRGGPA